MCTEYWMIDSLKIYKVCDKIIKFFREATKCWKVELTAGEKFLAEMKIQRGIFQGDMLLTLVLLITMMPRNNILRNCCEWGRKFSKSQKRYPIMYMDSIKLFAKIEKELENLIEKKEYTAKISEWNFAQKNVPFCIEKCALRKGGKRQITEGRKKQDVWRKRKFEILEQYEDERKNEKSLPETKKASRNEDLQQKYHKRDEYLNKKGIQMDQLTNRLMIMRKMT